MELREKVSAQWEDLSRNGPSLPPRLIPSPFPSLHSTMASFVSSATNVLLRSAPSASSGGIVGPWAAQVRRSLLEAPLRAAAVANGSAAVKNRNKKGAGGGGLEIREAEEYLTTDVQLLSGIMLLAVCF
ncbi:hypothetical protein ACQ4PT_018110 [Festuca glaucescens]